MTITPHCGAPAERDGCICAAATEGRSSCYTQRVVATSVTSPVTATQSHTQTDRVARTGFRWLRAAVALVTSSAKVTSQWFVLVSGFTSRRTYISHRQTMVLFVFTSALAPGDD